MELQEITEENIERNLPACLALQKHLVHDPDSIVPAQFKATAQEPNSYFLGLFEEDVLVGMGVASKIVHPVATVAYINNIVVSPDYRGRGFFSVIMDSLEAKAKEWECERVDLTCSRQQVQGMYEKRGYAKKRPTFIF